MEELVQQVVNGIMIGSTYALIATGFGLVFSVMRVLNMAHPDLAMVGAYVAYLIGTRLLGGANSIAGAAAVGLFVVVLVAGMSVASGVGLVLERLVIRPTRGTYLLIPFIATAGVGIFLENGANVIFGSIPVPVPYTLPYYVFDLSGIRFSSAQLATLLTAFATLMVVKYYVGWTRWGLATRAVAERADVAAACGVNVNLVSQLTIGIASAMAGAAGVTISILQTNADPFMGLLLGLKSFVCMLVAGNRRLEGILLVGLVLGLLEAMVTAYVSAQLRDAVSFLLLLAILMFRPQGLFGSYPA